MNKRRAGAARPRPDATLELAVSHKAAALFAVELAGDALGGLYVLAGRPLRVRGGVLPDSCCYVVVSFACALDSSLSTPPVCWPWPGGIPALAGASSSTHIFYTMTCFTTSSIVQ